MPSLPYAGKMIKLENVRGVVWDLDGTLLDSFGVFEQVVAEIVAEGNHATPTREHMLHNYHGTLDETLERVLNLQSAKEVGDMVMSFLAKQEPHYADDVDSHLFPDAVALAQRAAKKDLPQLLLTNRSHKNRGYASPRAIVANTVLAACIHEVRPGDEVEYRKPDKRSICGWMEEHSLQPQEVLVVGDQFVDAQLALNIGAQAVLVARDEVIPHLEKLSHPDGESTLTTIHTVRDLAEVELV